MSRFTLHRRPNDSTSRNRFKARIKSDEDNRMVRGSRFVSFVVACVATSGLAAIPATTANAGASSPWIDTSDRGAVLAAWDLEFSRTEPAIGFTGDVGSCVAGTTSAAFRASITQRVNWYRRMAGLDTVTESASYTTASQAGALIMAAQGNLSHSPPSNWACYDSVGANAAGNSNIGLGVNGLRAMDAYMQDSGASNTRVGHRRTMLYPQLREIGSGDIPSAAGNSPSNVLHVFDSNLWSTRPTVRETTGFVAWPPSGYVPAQTVWGRWSFSLARANFSAATVSVTSDQGPVAVKVLDRIQANGNGLIAPEASIVWAVNGDNGSARFPEPANGDECYDVSVANVTSNGNALAPFNYTTCVLDTDWIPGSTSSGSSANQSSMAAVCPSSTYGAWTPTCWSAATLRSQRFADVVESWQQLPVAWLVANGITTGINATQFDPNGLITRAQAATFIWRLAGSPAPSRTAPRFNDVGNWEYYTDAVRWMAENTITTGVGGGNFGPNRLATRAQLVTFLWRLVDRPAVGSAAQFGDLTADWQSGPVGWAASVKVTTGTSATTFDPDTPVTRGQAAAFLARLATALG